MNNQFKYIFTNKKNTHDDIIFLINEALKQKEINYKFKRVFNVNINSKKPFRAYQIYKHRGK